LRSFIAQAWGSVCMYERHTGEPDWRNRMDETALYV
jgi:truncated hemoglobin YjbI